MAEIAAKSKRLDEDHTFYVDASQGYYFHTYAQARKYAIKCLMQVFLHQKKNPRRNSEYYINIDRAYEYKRVIQRGFKPTTSFYVKVWLMKTGDSFIIRESPYYSNFTEKETKLSRDKALEYARMQI